MTGFKTYSMGIDIVELVKFAVLMSVLLNVAAALTGASNTRLWACGVTAATWFGFSLWRQINLWRRYRVRVRLNQGRWNWVWLVAVIAWSVWLLSVTFWCDWIALSMLAAHRGQGISLWALMQGAGWAMLGAILEIITLCLLHLVLRWLLLRSGKPNCAHWTRFGIHLKPGACVSRNVFLLSKANLLVSCIAALLLMGLTGHIAWLIGAVLISTAVPQDFEAWTLLTLPSATQVGETTSGDLLIYLPEDGEPVSPLFAAREGGVGEGHSHRQ